MCYINFASNFDQGLKLELWGALEIIFYLGGPSEILRIMPNPLHIVIVHM
jgi:hypothetical protein